MSTNLCLSSSFVYRLHLHVPRRQDTRVPTTSSHRYFLAYRLNLSFSYCAGLKFAGLVNVVSNLGLRNITVRVIATSSCNSLCFGRLWCAPPTCLFHGPVRSLVFMPGVHGSVRSLVCTAYVPLSRPCTKPGVRLVDFGVHRLRASVTALYEAWCSFQTRLHQ